MNITTIASFWRVCQPWTITFLSLFVIGAALVAVSRWRWRVKYSRKQITFKVKLGFRSKDIPFRSEQLFNSLHGTRLPWYRRLLRGQPHQTFVFRNYRGRKALHVIVPDYHGLPDRVARVIADKLTGCEIEIVDDLLLPSMGKRKFGLIKQAFHSVFGLRTLKGLENDDPTEHIWNSLDIETAEGLCAVIIMVKPCGRHWTKRGVEIREHVRSTDDPDPRRAAKSTGLRGIFNSIASEFFSIFSGVSGSSGTNPVGDKRSELSDLSKEVIKSMDAKLASHSPYRCVVIVIVDYNVASRHDVERIASAFKHFDKHQVLRCKHVFWPYTRLVGVLAARNLWPVFGSGDIMSPEELSGIIHNPFATTTIAKLDFNSSRLLPPAHDLVSPCRDNIELGYNDFRGRSEAVSIPLDDFRLHAAIIGVTGSGKSTLIKAIIRQWVRDE